jgi:hypothetical protein
MSQGRRITFGGELVIAANREQYPQAARLANSYVCPLGPAAGTGWLLLTQKSMKRFDKSPELPRDLVFETFGENAKKVTIKKLFIDRGVRLAGGSERTDDDAVQLVRVVDVRYMLNRWSMTSVKPYVSQFNVRNWSGGDPDRYFVRETVLGFRQKGSWNWVLRRLWEACGTSILGPYPTVAGIDALPAPEDLQLNGLNAWHALNELLAKINLVIVYAPQLGAFTITNLRGKVGAIDVKKNAPPILYEANPFSGGATVGPKTIRVNFRTHYEDYGYERDTEAERNWMTSVSGFYIDVPTGIKGALAGTVLPLWDNTPAVKPHGSDHTDAAILNLADLQAIATKRVQSWLNRRGADKDSRAHTVWAGLHAIRPASNIRRVIWRDFGSADEGLVTEAMTYPRIDVGEVDLSKKNGGGFFGDFEAEDYDGGGTANEHFQAHDFARKTAVNYPRLPNFVQITIGNADTANCGDGTSGGNFNNFLRPYEGSAIFGGKVLRYRPKTAGIETLEDCWILVIGETPGCEKGQFTGARVRLNEILYGRLSGMYVAKSGAHKGLRLPLYVVRANELLSVAEYCPNPQAATFRKCQVDHIEFDKRCGFTVSASSCDADGVRIGLKGCKPNMVLSQISADGCASWTDFPTLQGVRFAGGGTISGNGGAFGGVNLRLPTSPATGCCQPLQSAGVSGKCVQLEFGPRGVTGYMFAMLYESHPCDDSVSYECHRIDISCGRILGFNGANPFGYFTDQSQCPSATPPPKQTVCNPCGDDLEIQTDCSTT